MFPRQHANQPTMEHGPAGVKVISEDASPIASYIRNASKATEGLSSTLHTETNMSQDSSAQSFAFDDNTMATGDRNAPIRLDLDDDDDVSITDEFIQDSKPAASATAATDGMKDVSKGSMLSSNHSREDVRNRIDSFLISNCHHLHRSAPSLMFAQTNARPPHSNHQLQSKMHSSNPSLSLTRDRASIENTAETLFGRSHGSLRRTFRRHCSNGSPQKVRSQSSEMKRSGVAPSRRSDMKLSGHSLSMPNMKRIGIASSMSAEWKHTGIAPSRSVSEMKRRNGLAPALYEMKRKGIAPRKGGGATELAFGSPPPRAKISQGMRNRLIRELYPAHGSKSRSQNHQVKK